MPIKSVLSPSSLKPSLISIALVTNAFVWYYFIIELLKAAVSTAQFNASVTSLVWILHFGGIGVSALLGAILAEKIKNRVNFLICWMIFGVLLSSLSAILNLTLAPVILMLSTLFGVSLGVGMPSCMGYFANNIPIERRGRAGGIIFLLTGLTIVILGILAGEGVGLKAITLTGWRLLGLLVFLLLLSYSAFKEHISNKNSMPARKMLTEKPFLFYLIPWLMFSLITNLTIPMQSSIIQTMQNSGVNVPSIEVLTSIDNIVIAVFAVIAGFLIDHVGRKKMSILGFAVLGVGYSVLGIFSENPLFSPFSWYFYIVSDGIAWGIFFVVFVTTIWADISNRSHSEKYYAVGVLPFFISYFLRLTVGFDLSSMVPSGAIFSFVAFFLFMAVLPLVYAPETLPEKVMKDRDLKSYIEKAKKKAQKDAEKTRRIEKNATQSNQRTDESLQDDKNYEEAKALAEKYY